MSLPTHCSLALVASDQFPGATIPAFTTCFSNDHLIGAFNDATVIRLEADPKTQVDTTIKLTTISHDDCECPEPLVDTIAHDVSSKKATAFIDSVRTADCYFWILSTPSYEARALVNAKTHEVVQRHVIERIIH